MSFSPGPTGQRGFMMHIGEFSNRDIKEFQISAEVIRYNQLILVTDVQDFGNGRTVRK